MAVSETNADFKIDGKLQVTNVPNRIGTFVTLDPLTNDFCKRTIEETKEDLEVNTPKNSLDINYANLNTKDSNGLIDFQSQSLNYSYSEEESSSLQIAVLNNLGLWVELKDIGDLFYSEWGVRKNNADYYVTQGSVELNRFGPIDVVFNENRLHLIAYQNSHTKDYQTLEWVNYEDLLIFKNDSNTGKKDVVILGVLIQKFTDNNKYIFKVNPRFI